MSGPNGVTSSADGKTLYVNLWAEKKVLKYDRDTKASQTVDIAMLPDNVRWSQDRKYMLVGGQDASVKSVIDCFESKDVNCTTPFKVDKLDPATMKLTELVKSGVYDQMGAGTGALQVGPDLWVSTFRSDRIVRFPALLAH
jgi:sugar lactone lactonase YvrE